MVRIFYKHKTKDNMNGHAIGKVSVSEAKALVKKLNSEYPELTHWYQ